MYLNFLKIVPVYDLFFVQFVIGPIFICAWRGTWQNADALFDSVVFNGDVKSSTIFALALGIGVSMILIYSQHELREISLSGSR